MDKKIDETESILEDIKAGVTNIRGYFIEILGHGVNTDIINDKNKVMIPWTQ